MVFHALAKRRFCLRFLSTRENTSLSAFQPFLQYFTAGSDIASFQDYEEKEFVECFSRKLNLSTYLHTVSYNHIKGCRMVPQKTWVSENFGRISKSRKRF